MRYGVGRRSFYIQGGILDIGFKAMALAFYSHGYLLKMAIIQKSNAQTPTPVLHVVTQFSTFATFEAFAASFAL